ncbi:hypothetical protein AWENTII_001082 [Aspergillus wentii]
MYDSFPVLVHDIKKNGFNNRCIQRINIHHHSCSPVIRLRSFAPSLFCWFSALRHWPAPRGPKQPFFSQGPKKPCGV